MIAPCGDGNGPVNAGQQRQTVGRFCEWTEFVMHRQSAFRISTACELTGLGRTTIYAAIKAGELIARKRGRRTVILAEDLNEFLHALPKSVSDQVKGRKGQ